MDEKLGYFSIREKNLWFDLFVDVVVALYYYPRIFNLVRRGDEALMGGEMAALIGNTIGLAIITSVVLHIFLHIKGKPEPKDERDMLIDARSSIWFGRLLMAGLILIICQIMLQQFSVWQPLPDLNMTPLVIAHLLLGLMMISTMLISIFKIWLYRQGL